MSGVWLSRTLLHPIMSERADAGGKSAMYHTIYIWLDRGQRGIGPTSTRGGGGGRINLSPPPPPSPSHSNE